MKETKHLGALSGKILVFGGVYSNLQSLDKLIKLAENEEIKPSNIICTGDIVGYCSQPDECLRTIKAWGIYTILGNVEENIRDGNRSCGCNFDSGTRCDIFSRQWYPYAVTAISDEMKNWLHKLPHAIQFDYADKKVLVIHGGLEDNAQFIFHSTDWNIKKMMLERAGVDVMIAGHCGLPFHSLANNQYWLNAGVIGMPANDSTSRVWYMILEDQSNFNFMHQAYEYNHKKTIQGMQKNNLPIAYAKTLATGIWDNCEILPVKEIEKQGVKIKF